MGKNSTSTAARIVARILGDVAVATALYGLWLLSVLAFQG